jgi:hypothetical protein
MHIGRFCLVCIFLMCVGCRLVVGRVGMAAVCSLIFPSDGIIREIKRLLAGFERLSAEIKRLTTKIRRLTAKIKRIPNQTASFLPLRPLINPLFPQMQTQ